MIRSCTIPFLLPALFLFFIPLHGQDGPVELTRAEVLEIEEKVSQLQPAEAVESLNKLVLHYIAAGEMDKAIALSGEMMEQAEEAGSDGAVRMALTRRAQSLYISGNYGQSIVYLQRLVEHHQQEENKEREAGFRNFLANANLEMGNHQEAIEQFGASLIIYEELGNLQGQAGVLNNIALIYKNLGDTEKELEYYYRSLDVARSAGEQQVIAIAASNIGESYITLGELNEAERYLEEALQISREIGDDDSTTYCLTQFGRLEAARQNYQQARDYLIKAEELATEKGFRKDLFTVLLERGSVENATGNYETAMEMAGRAETLARELNLQLETAKPVRLRSEIYEARGEMEKALELMKEYHRVEDEIDQRIQREQVLQLQARFELSRREQEIAEARQELQQKQNDQRNLIIIIVLLLLLLALICWLYLTKSRNNRRIREKNDKLEDAYERMEMLARTDDLTGLHNRRSINLLIKHEQHRQERNQKPFSFIIADVDHFKQINDSHGHDTGDKVLKWIADSLLSMVRKQDRICRWGGEELLLMLPETRLDGATELAWKLVQYFREHRFVEGETSVGITLTCGVAVCEPGSNPRTAIELADKAMYKGKDHGRNQVQVTESSAGDKETE